MKKTKLLFIIMLMLFPTIVYASNGFNSIPLPMAIIIVIRIYILKVLKNTQILWFMMENIWAKDI